MTIYICKCGRRVSKSTNADNTGNRDTAGCRGCPYLLPWGPTEWTGKGFEQNVQGHECRMSPEISYATDYSGSANDKCTLKIHSLDLDFLEDIQAWIDEYADGQLSGRFSRDTIRGTDYCNKGRYSWSISCAQNKKGMAAKAALIERFFGPDGHRLDKTPEEEKAIVLAAIEAGKAKAQERKENMDYIIGKHVATGRLYAYYKGSFWFWDSHVQRWLLSQFAEDLYQEERPKRWNFEREHFLAQTSDFHQLDDYEVPSRCIEALLQCNPKTAKTAEKGNPTSSAAATAAAEETAATPEPLDSASMTAAPVAKTNAEVVDATNKVAASSNLPDVCRDCQCATCGNEGCASSCWENPREVGDCEITGPAGDACRDYRPKEDVQCQKANAPSADAAATSDESAARMCEDPDEETRTTPAAASGAALESLPAQAAPQSNEPAQDIAVDAPSAQAFDYSGLDAETAERLQNLARRAMEAKQRYVLDLMEIVVEAHRELCDTVVARCDNGTFSKKDDTFRAWCASIGVSKDTAYRLLQVQALMDGSTPEEQEALADAPVKLLYAAAKPSAPAELVQAVKDGNITTHKQYQEVLAEIKARDAKIQELLEMSEGADRRADAAEARAQKAEQERDAARDAQAASSRLTNMITNQRDEAQIRAEKAELRARAAEEDAAEKDKRIRELETGRPQTIEATVVERIRMPEMAKEDAAELTTNLAASVTTVQRSFFMAAAAMAPQVKARCANTLWDTVNELATLLAASANPSYEEEEATPFD